MEATPKVTVVIAVLNAEEYIDSVTKYLQRQTYSNWSALFVISDKSTDDTEAKVKAIDDSRFSYVVYRDKGALGGSKNIGLDLADGKYIWFLDSDDIPSKNYLSKTVGLALKYNAEVSACNFMYSRTDKDPGTIHGNFKVKVMNSEEAILERASERFPVSSWSMLYDLDMIRRHNLRFSEGISEDILFTYKCLNAAKVVCYNDEPLYTYVVRTNSICNINSDSRGITELQQYNLVRELLKPEHGSTLDTKIIQCMLRSMGHLTVNGFLRESRSKEISMLIESSNNPLVRLEGGVIRHMPKVYYGAIKFFFRAYYYQTGRFFTRIRV